MKTSWSPPRDSSSRLLAVVVALVVPACASRQGTMKTAYHGSQIVAAAPVAADDTAMRQKPGTVKSSQTGKASSKVTEHDTEMSSTETTTVESTSAVASPDGEVKVSQ